MKFSFDAFVSFFLRGKKQQRAGNDRSREIMKIFLRAKEFSTTTRDPLYEILRLIAHNNGYVTPVQIQIVRAGRVTRRVANGLE